jgi:hypothetical protein
MHVICIKFECAIKFHKISIGLQSLLSVGKEWEPLMPLQSDVLQFSRLILNFHVHFRYVRRNGKHIVCEIVRGKITGGDTRQWKAISLPF